MEYIRDYAMYAAIFGFFSFSWFGWAQENPRKSWRKYIGMASSLPLIICLIGIYLSVNNWEEATALSDSSVFKSYLFFVFIEFFLAAIGAILLIKLKQKDYIAPWIVFIVGIHFFWLKNVFKDPSLNILGILLVGVALLSLFLSKKLRVANSAITGIGAGTILFCFAILGLIRFLLV
ncbi:hypothetical protein [Paenibacillus sp. LHD-38]|uniref:hypothetical protein n=1 Tax=Paenibacillus sp. LHD-38 TaxID=3072143 RepID=UPI00280F697A|nr:hypothetical protein [Paenibacillus sp. LHD-38]MDQ8736955.1 hypothetical protein [Paenibacillus sp. LHD-38]